MRYTAHETATSCNPVINILQQTENTRQIINKPTLKQVTFLQKCKDQQCFVDKTFGQKVCL